MAETELEALNEIIGQNEDIILNQEEIILNQEELISELGYGETSKLNSIISNQTAFQELFFTIEETPQNKLDLLVTNTTPIYEVEDAIANNTFVFENLQEIKEMQFSNYILIGVV